MSKQFYIKQSILGYVHFQCQKLFHFKQFSFAQVRSLKANNSKLKPWFSSIWPIDGTLSGATTPSQLGPGSDSNEGILWIPQSSSLIGTLPSDCLASYPGHLLGGVLPFSRGVVGVFYSPSWLSNGGYLCVWEINWLTNSVVCER